jgi:methylenetetrahydrofolate dehydrogenase (NADP+)/methenyltetrahydrofolate cyclohydrolase
MAAQILNGNALRETLLEEMKIEVQNLKEKTGSVPGLVTILVGSNPASLSYVGSKIKTAQDLGFHELQQNLDKNITESELLGHIEHWNKDPAIHGILVQLPLPKHIDEKKIITAIDPDKDVDGFHPVNLGRLLIGGDEVKFPPCTPAGIHELLKRANIQISGQEVVVVGRSNIVGKPIATMLMQKGEFANATVTVVHTGTKDLASHCKRADILIVAAGVPELVQPEWIKPGAAVIDVGVNRVGEKISEKTGRTIALLKGDVDFERASQIAGFITPVPGGVGPMTITMLMKNTLKSFKCSQGLSE